MLIPISKLLENGSRKISYNLYDVDTHEVSNWTHREIKEAMEAGRDIRGFTGHDSSLRLKSYYSNIGTIGVKSDDKQYYTVVQRRVYSKVTKFVIVDCVGKDFELKQSELINLMKEGATVAGAKLDKNDALRVSRDIETKIIR